jgi:hypothetical protein
MRALTGLEFAPFLAFMRLHGESRYGSDSNREHVYPVTARPQGLTRNSLAAPATVDLDLRALKMIPLHAGHLDILEEVF